MILLFEFSTVTYYGIALLIFGIAVKFLLSYRKFQRRGVAGLQHFSNYWKGVLIITLEKFAGISSLFIILLGLVLVFLELFNNR